MSSNSKEIAMGKASSARSNANRRYGKYRFTQSLQGLVSGQGNASFVVLLEEGGSMQNKSPAGTGRVPFGCGGWI